MSTVSPGTNPYAPPQAEVADRGADGEVQLASRLRRFGASVLDTVVTWLCFVPIFVGINFEAFGRAATTDDAAAMLDAISMMGLGVAAVVLLIWTVINIYLVATNAQTVGKRLLGIKVACTDGSRAGFARIFWLRNVVNWLPSMVPFVGFFYSWLIDPLFVFGESRRCLHDHIAGTIVVDA